MSQPLPPPPSGNPLAWAMQNPEALGAYLAAVYRLSRLRIVVDNAGVKTSYGLKDATEDCVIEIKV